MPRRVAGELELLLKRMHLLSADVPLLRLSTTKRIQNSEEQAYSGVYMKKSYKNIFGDRIVITTTKRQVFWITLKMLSYLITKVNCFRTFPGRQHTFPVLHTLVLFSLRAITHVTFNYRQITSL